MSAIDAEMQDLAMTDLGAAGEHLYIAAQRYVRAFKRQELDHICSEQDHTHMNVGTAAELLHEAALRHGAAYERAEASGCFGECAEDDL